MAVDHTDPAMLSSATSVGVAATSANPSHVYRFSILTGGSVVLAFALLFVAFRSALDWLWVTWTTQLEYSHGPLMPLIALFLVWQQKDHLEALPFVGDWRGPALVILCGFLYLIGVMGAVYTLQQYGLVLGMAGLALSLSGAVAFRRLVAPVIVLSLAVPQPMFILNNLSSELQLISSSLGVLFLRAVGVSVFLEGNIIDLGGYRLQVVEACSGLRYLFPLMTIGLLIAYFYKGAMWKRVVVFLLSIPITVLMNSLRVGMIGVMVDRWGVGMAEGFLHEFQGWMVFMTSAAVLLGCTAALNRITRESAPWRQLFGVDFPAPTPAKATVLRRPLPTAFIVAAGLVGGIAILGVTIPTRTEIVPPREQLSAFPRDLAGWVGHASALSGEIRDALAVDDYLLSDYTSSSGDVVNFYVSYYNSQRDRHVVHSPRACIPGAGWRIEDIRRVPFASVDAPVNRMIVANGDAREIVYYWFDQRGRNLSSEYSVKWYLLWDGLTRRRTDGSMVRFVTILAPGESEAAGDARIERFAKKAVPLLPRYIPQ